MATPIAYNGTADSPWPPAPDGWHACLWDDELARDFSQRKIEELPLWYFCDELTPCGLYRFFHYETPIGTAVGALRYEGTMGRIGRPMSHEIGTMGQGPYVCADGTVVDDPSLCPGGTGVPIPDTGGGGGSSDQGGGGLSAGGGGASDSGNGALTQGGGGGGGGGSGQTTNEPIPGADATCGAWVPDASNAQAVSIAQNISFHNQPVPWADQGVYSTTINGTEWRFVMWWDNGLKNVAAFRCTQPITPSVTKAGFGWGAALLAALIAAGGIAAAVFGTKGHRVHAHA
jgi:hypothetical protein